VAAVAAVAAAGAGDKDKLRFAASGSLNTTTLKGLSRCLRGAGELKCNDKCPGFREGFAGPLYGDLGLKP
jgi:hypothetical protein